MADFLLVPGAGGESSYWSRVEPCLRHRGHEVISPQLPAEDDSAGLGAYVDVLMTAAEGASSLVVVAQSMGAFSGSILPAHRQVELLVLVAPMIPRPGESGGEWWSNTSQGEAARAAAIREGRNPDADFDPDEIFLHDVPQQVLSVLPPPRDQSSRPFEDPWPLKSWPEVPTRVVAGSNDRLFPLDFIQRLSRERLGIEPDVVDAGHLVALSNPVDLVALLDRYLEVAAT